MEKALELAEASVEADHNGQRQGFIGMVNETVLLAARDQMDEEGVTG